jgi:photosystem II stability/assembly factor-like uncharacterized protein
MTLFAQWYEKPNGLPDSAYAYAIDAYDSLIATGPFTRTPDYIPDSLYLTTDGGNNWYTRSLPNGLESYEYLYDISIPDKDKIWFCTGKGKIYNTTDGGSNWQLQFYDASMTGFMNYIEMFDSLNGMAMGDAPANNEPALFLKTTNGGIDWISQNSLFFLGESIANIWRSVDFININTGYFFLFNGPLYKTTNGGFFWQVFSDNYYMNVIKAYDENIFLGNDSNPRKMHRTTDGGLNWESYQSDLLFWGNDIEFIPDDPSNVWYAADAVCFSSDTGRTWSEEFTLSNNKFWDIVFTDENNGWLLAEESNYKTRIFRTTNGGRGGIVSVDNNVIDFKPDGFSLKQNYPNPFNPSTKIKFHLPEISFVRIKVYDLIGKEVATLVNEEKSIGSYGVEFNATALPSGIYFYQLQAGNYVETKKMILMK